MKKQIQERVISNHSKSIYQPVFFDLTVLNDKENLKNLLDNNQSINIIDTIGEQLKELIKIENPSHQFPEKEIEKIIKNKLGEEPEKYGIWVYYPWKGLLVHLLGMEEFIKVRTNRNKYKITQEEQDLLSSKVIGVVGLSVGQSVALTMAMERSFGELRIADFDTIDLSNLNRIRTGVNNLSIAKTVVVAREIYEIDPFLKITLFNEGLTNDNMSDFLKDLDVLIDECDSLDLKINMRIEAKKLKIPVVMDTSDKGLIDVERFDLEPNIPILHGLIEHLDIDNVKDLTNQQKIPYALAMVGGDSISERLKFSMNEVGKTISTWPQLAADVVAGGGHTAFVSREICLSKPLNSGRYYIDLDKYFY